MIKSMAEKENQMCVVHTPLVDKYGPTDHTII